MNALHRTANKGIDCGFSAGDGRAQSKSNSKFKGKDETGIGALICVHGIVF